jgi:hypothetical protein
METVHIQGKSVTIGRCIYCLSRENLSDEHTVPFSLGGDVAPKDASCDRCSGITSYLDGYLARNKVEPVFQPNSPPPSFTERNEAALSCRCRIIRSP